MLQKKSKKSFLGIFFSLRQEQCFIILNLESTPKSVFYHKVHKDGTKYTTSRFWMIFNTLCPLCKSFVNLVVKKKENE